MMIKIDDILTDKMHTNNPTHRRDVKKINPILAPTFYKIGPTSRGKTMFGRVGISTNQEYSLELMFIEAISYSFMKD